MACFCMIYSQNTFPTWFVSFVLIFMDNNLVSQIMGWPSLPLKMVYFTNSWWNLLTLRILTIHIDTLNMGLPIVLFVWFDSLCPINNLSVIKRWVFLGWTSTKLDLMCLAQGHIAVKPVRLKPAAPRSHSSTLPLSHSPPRTAHCGLWRVTGIIF